jgi:hypothetical protein
MPQQTQNNMKGHSPSPNIQRGVDTAWGAQKKVYTDPKAALAAKPTNNPIKVGKSKS